MRPAAIFMQRISVSTALQRHENTRKCLHMQLRGTVGLCEYRGLR
jgi:hypothetical protein